MENPAHAEIPLQALARVFPPKRAGQAPTRAAKPFVGCSTLGVRSSALEVQRWSSKFTRSGRVQSLPGTRASSARKPGTTPHSNAELPRMVMRNIPAW